MMDVCGCVCVCVCVYIKTVECMFVVLLSVGFKSWVLWEE